MVTTGRRPDGESEGWDWEAGADALVQTGRRRVVVALGTARAQLTSSPANHRDEIQAELIHQLNNEATTFTHAATKYAAAAATNRGDAAKEFEARGDQCRAFATALEDIDESRPWFAALSTTTAESVRTDRFDDLQDTPPWRLAQQASIEATVSCMPPAVHSWSAADGRGIQRLNDLEADVADWSGANQWIPGGAGSDLLLGGHRLREEIGSRLKPGLERTDVSEWGIDDAIDKAEFVRTHDAAPPTSDVWALNHGIPVAIDSFPAPVESVEPERNAPNGAVRQANHDPKSVRDDDWSVDASIQPPATLPVTGPDLN